MTIHILIPVHNRLDKTKNIVNCIKEQTSKNWELWVVDDGSSDGTRDYLSSKKYIHLIAGDGDLWWCGAVDLACKEIIRTANEDDYLLLLNNDATIGKDYIETLESLATKYPNKVIGSLLRENQPPYRLLSVGPVADLWRMTFWDAMKQYAVIDVNTPELIKVSTLPGRGTLYPIRVVKETGGFRPKLFPHYWADYEMGFRANRRGYETVVSKLATVYSEDDFGVSNIKMGIIARLFSKRSAQNIFSRIAFYCVVGTLAQRITAIPRMIVFAAFRKTKYLLRRL